MKFRSRAKKQLKTSPEELEERIKNYLINNFYRITERGAGYIIFVDDEFSDRKRSRSDFHTRIDIGKIEFYSSGNGETNVQLTYFTSILYPAFLAMLFTAFGIYIDNIIMPIIFSCVLSLPILTRVYYIKGRVFNDMLGYSSTNDLPPLRG